LSSSIIVKFKFDTGWYDVSNKTRVKDFFTEKYIYKSLKPTIDICRFKIKYDQFILSKLLLATYDIEAVVTRDGKPYFKGVVKPSYLMKSKSKVEWVEVQLDDNGYKLDKSINEDFILNNVYLCNSNVVTSATENGCKQSLVHYLLYKAGYDASVFEYPLVSNIVLSYFIHLKAQPDTNNDALSKIPYGGSYKELLTNILFQYGFTYYFDDAGRIRLFNYKDTNIAASTSVNNTNMIDTLTVEKNEPTYDAVEISWYGNEVLRDQLLFVDDGGTASGLHPYGNMYVAPNTYYPTTSNANTMTDVYYNIQFEDGRKTEDIISINNTVLDTTYYGYDQEVTNTWQETVTSTKDEPIYGWVLVDSYTMYTWFPVKPGFVNGTTIKAHYIGYYCRGFLCYKDGHKWRIDTYAWTVTGYKKVTVGTVVEKQSITIVYKAPSITEEVVWNALSFKLRIKNKSTQYPMWIRKLHVRGDVVLRSILNITRNNYSQYTERMMKYKANYIYDDNYATLLSSALRSYFEQSSYTYKVKCTEELKVGQWVLLTDNNFQNVNNFPVQNKRCLVVSVKENEYTNEKTYLLEQYKDLI
jgi:hypothetical protein